MSTVYIGMSLDVLHHGHINIISKAAEYGSVVIGLLTDRAIASHKRLPFLDYRQREILARGLQHVAQVVEQDEWDYSSNLLKYKPDFMIHGNDWLSQDKRYLRDNAIKALESYGGKLIEVEYTHGISSTELVQTLNKLTLTSDLRRNKIQRMLRAGKLVRVMEAHSPLAALIVENEKVFERDLEREFDGFWSSSLTDSTENGKPDTEALSMSERLRNIDRIFDVTTKPLIIDADTGGQKSHFAMNVQSMERMGISAVIIEDKTGLKRNSLFGNEVAQTQESVEEFCDKIKAGSDAKKDESFMIIARIESLILEAGMNDALDRAHAYVKAGADAIMIHSRLKDGTEIRDFAKKFRSLDCKTPLVCVPTSYNHIREEELEAWGFNIVIYANHMLRASYPAMKAIAGDILANRRSKEVDDKLISISEILNLIPGTKG